MIPVDVSLSASEAASNRSGQVSLGGVRGGGTSFSFGGINDSPVSKWIWIGLGAVLLIGGGLLWWSSRKKNK